MVLWTIHAHFEFDNKKVTWSYKEWRSLLEHLATNKFNGQEVNYMLGYKKKESLSNTNVLWNSSST